MRKLLKTLYIVETISNKNRTPKLGRGYSEAHRLRWYNPLSYILVIGVIILGLIMFGVVGFKQEVDTRNPFKWI
jgi:hypothetical protein